MPATRQHRTASQSDHTTPRPRPRLSILRGTLIAFLLALSGVFGLQACRASNSGGLPQPQLAAASFAAPKLHTIPIQDITVGHRVLGENPELTDADRAKFGPEPDPATWRKLELRAPKTDGSWADVSLLRPLDWLQQQNAHVGGTVEIDVPECGIEGEAEVLTIGACPPIKQGPGQVVTGTFHHQSAQVVDLHITGRPEPIGTTANHPFWSEDCQKFVRADELRIGELLRTATGLATIAEVVPRSMPEQVFNLEIHGEHVFWVTVDGVLTHNGTTNPFPSHWNLGPEAMGVVYEIQAVVDGKLKTYVGSTWNPYRLMNSDHPARELLDMGMQLKVRVRIVDLSDAAAYAASDGVDVEHAAQRILRTQEELSLRQMADVGESINRIAARNAMKFKRDLLRYGDRRSFRQNITRFIRKCP